MRFTHTGPAPTDRNDWQTLRTLFPYIWAFKGRVLLALILLISAKVANVSVPLFLKEIVDQLSFKQALLVVPIAGLIGYGAARLASSICLAYLYAFTWIDRPGG